MKTSSPFGRFFVLIVLLIVSTGTVVLGASPSGLWRDLDEQPMLAARGRLSAPVVRNGVVPSSYRTLHLDRAKLAATLAAALPEGALRKAQGVPAEALPAPAVLELPVPHSVNFARFTVELSPVMEPGLAAKYPDIQTYIAQGIDDPELTARLDVTALGFHAMVLSPQGQIFVDPYFVDGSEPEISIAYYKKDYSSAFTMPCLVLDKREEAISRASAIQPAKPSGASLRVYRLAVGATGEYAMAVGGGDVTMTLGAIVTTVNRVDAIYEKDFCIRMVLVNNEDKIIYTNGATDPYDNSNANDIMLTQNQTVCDGVIGTANYDIGHVFSTGAGGVAYRPCVCNASNKAGGVTGRPNPTGDPYDIDYVAHEMGHQYGGNHTFNSTTNACNGNRSAAHAYEPGSGTTVMAYAGICSTVSNRQDLAPHSDDYFHTTSYDEIDAYTTTGVGANVVLPRIATGNTPPTVAAPVAYTIPISTPFALTAAATDPDGDRLTYCWEEFDLGGAVNSTTISGLDNGASPLFRSYAPTASPTRTFPSLAYILNNANVPPLTGTVDGNYLVGEALPSKSRAKGLNFRCTVRDNRAGGGGSNYAEVKLTVDATSGPFAITAPNSAASYAAGASLPVTWNVANTAAAPVACANVKIILSTDGGLTFPFVLAASVPNSGSAVVVLPAVASVATQQARIKVEAVGNIFFDIDDANFTITSTNTPPTFTANGNGIQVVRGTPGAVSATVGSAAAGSSALSTVTVSGAPEGVAVTGSLSASDVILSATAQCRVTTTLAARTYPLSVTVTDAAGAASSGTINLLLAPNATPTVGTYADASVGQGGSTVDVPSGAPADANGNLLAAPLSLSPTTVLPAGVTLAFDQATGAATFTATAGAALGSSTLRLQVQDTCGATAERPLTLTVTPPVASAPVFTRSTPPSGATAGVGYSYTFAASGSPTPTYGVTAGTLPPGLSLSSTSGLLAGTPTAPGVYSGVQVTASNSAGAASSQTFSIRVVNTQGNYAAGFGLTGANAAPAADPDADGLSNLLEYALNLNPTASDAGSAALPAATVALRPYGSEKYLSIRFTRVPLATDITYVVEGSSDLASWTAVATGTGGAALGGPGVVSDDGSTTAAHTVEVRDTVSPGSDSASRRFLRLRITQP